MKSMKKTLVMVVSLVLIAAIALGGTLAYLTVDPVKKSNSFSVGNIAIQLNEEVKVIGEGGTVTFDDSGAEYSGVMPGDYLKKEVSVKNNGTKPAYVAVEVTLNNADLINLAIDEFYEGKGYSAYEIQRIYDFIFDGFGINYNPRPAKGGVSATGEANARGVIDGTFGLPEHTLKVDFAKTTNVSNDTYMIDTSNWFKTEQENNGSYGGFCPASKGYYTEDMTDYQIRYTYYLLLKEGEESVLFKGFNVPASFNAEQLKMFNNFKVDINASAIQADNIKNVKKAIERMRLINDGEVPAFEFKDEWDGTVDTSWYNDTDTEFILYTAEQLAGLAELVDNGNTFAGKTVKLGADFDLDSKIFEPIGSCRKNTPFMGVFDGQGHTIKNLSQNTWELDNGYYYGDLGLGLFGKVEDATVKNLIMDGAEISGESAIVGIVAGCAYGDCKFENINVTDSQGADYQYYAGGIVGWASGNHQYINCDVDETTTIGSQWGDFGNASGGIIGGAGSSATIYMKDCDVACRIDAVNDVVSAYQWHAYRNCGMLIGQTNHTATDDAVTNAAAPNLTCENVTVTYGEWANYTYCEFAGTGYPYVRVQAGTSVDAYSNVRYGHPTDANGNTVVDDNHVHNDGEDHQILIAFDQLYGGPGEHRYCTYGTATHDGVTVIYNNK